MEKGVLAKAGSFLAEAGIVSGAPLKQASEEVPRQASEEIPNPAPIEINSNPAVTSAAPDKVHHGDKTAGPQGGRKLCIVTDKNVAPLYGSADGALWKSLTDAGFELYTFVFEGGEKTKTLDTLAELLNFLADSRFTRSDILAALGGGIVGDVTGFAAASYLRGVEYIQIPTTLLAIVDSSVGGKTGVNLNAGKNLAGAFWQPSLVLFDPDVLRTLSYDTTLDGIAEAVKSGFIADSDIIDMAAEYTAGAGVSSIPSEPAEAHAAELHVGTPAAEPHAAGAPAENPAAEMPAVRVSAKASPAGIPETFPESDFPFLTRLAAKAVNVKRAIVEEDERESGCRQLLNFGHTPAHAIEKCSDYGISHGHAVAAGMVIVSAAADALGWTKEKCAGPLLNILQQFRFPLQCPYTPEELTAAALQDKKIRGSQITLVIPERPGRCTLKTIETGDLQQFITCGLEAMRDLQSE